MVKRNDGENFAKKVIELFSDSKLAERFGQAGKKLTQERFSLRLMVDQLERMYYKTMADCRARV